MASSKPTTRLRELHGSGYEIKKGQPDIRGWDVRDGAGRKFGRVHDLIFDIRANKVRYMVVNVLDTKELELERRTVLVPIGLAELDAADDDVILSAVTPFQLRALPRYDKSSLGAKVERDISHVFGRTGVASSSSTSSSPVVEEDVDNSFYEHEHFNEDNMQKNRRGTAINPLNTGTAHNTTGTNTGSTGSNTTSGYTDTGAGFTGTGTIGSGTGYTGTGSAHNNLDTNSERLRNNQATGNRIDEDPLVPGRTAPNSASDNVIYRTDLGNRNETDEEALRRLRQKGENDDTNRRPL